MLHKVSGLALASFLTSGEDTLLQDTCFQREPSAWGLYSEPVTLSDLCGAVDQLGPRGPGSLSPFGSKMNWCCSELRLSL